MINHIANVLRNNPLAVLEFLQYMKLLCLAVVGIYFPTSTYKTATAESIGNLLTNGQYVLALCAAIIGIFAIVTNRLVHRKNAMYVAFFAFALGTVVAVMVGFLSSVLPTTTLILNFISMLSCGAIAIHASWVIDRRNKRNDDE